MQDAHEASEGLIQACKRAESGSLPETASCAKRAVGGSASGSAPSDSSSMAGKNRFRTPAVPISGAAAPWLLDGVMKIVSLHTRCLPDVSRQGFTKTHHLPTHAGMTQGHENPLIFSRMAGTFSMNGGNQNLLWHVSGQPGDHVGRLCYTSMARIGY